jgi:hypothetical protein
MALSGWALELGGLGWLGVGALSSEQPKKANKAKAEKKASGILKHGLGLILPPNLDE